ncbi:MAG: PEP-CTERM sorting domain-containing protein [Gemmatimonadaceae bacterium]
MLRFSRFAVFAIVGTALMASPTVSQAQWQVDLFKVNVASSVDHNGPADACCSGLQTGWVDGVLNANRRPTLSALGASYVGANKINSVAAGGELAWWTAGGLSGAVVSDGTTTMATNFNTGGGWFPTGESNNSTWQRSALFTGYANNSGSGNWWVGADDDAWVFKNGSLVVDNGGVKGMGTNSMSSVSWLAGDRIEIFFADRNTVDSGIMFDGGELQLTTTTPEPGTYALIGTGLLALFAAKRRRRQLA